MYAGRMRLRLLGCWIAAALGAALLHVPEKKELYHMTQGTVKWFNDQRGYRFIQPDDGSKDVFVHIGEVERAGMHGLNEGQKVARATMSSCRRRAPLWRVRSRPGSTGGSTRRGCRIGATSIGRSSISLPPPTPAMRMARPICGATPGSVTTRRRCAPYWATRRPTAWR